MIAPDRSPYPLEERARARAMRRAIVQGFLSMIGHWLVGGWFVSFFAMELGAKGTMVGLVLAIGPLAGLLRIVAPYFVNRSDHRKGVWLWANIAARLISIGLPLLAFPQLRPEWVEPLWVMLAILSTSAICSTLGDVAWLSWYADIVPETIWGRYFGLRNAWMAVPISLTTLAGGVGMEAFAHHYPDLKLTGYAIAYAVGIAFNVGSLIPLLTVPNLRLRARPVEQPVWHSLAAPLKDPNFFRYALFHCWLMAGTGITQSAFHLYLKNHMGLSLLVMGLFQATNEVSKIAALRFVGHWTDRFGNKPLIVIGLLGAASGPFFWLPTRPGLYWPIFLAYVVWGAGWAAVNLGAQNLMLKVAPRGNNVAYIAAAQGMGGVAQAACLILGGLWLDGLSAAGFGGAVGPWTYTAYHVFFLLSFLGRSSAALWVFGIREPGARPIGHMVRALRRLAARRRRAPRAAPPSREALPAPQRGEGSP